MTRIRSVSDVGMIAFTVSAGHGLPKGRLS